MTPHDKRGARLHQEPSPDGGSEGYDTDMSHAPEPGATPGAPAGGERRESDAERADRNWTELTQEMRVTQTGVQILTAFLLILPFQQRFADITGYERVLYLALVSLAVVTTVLMVAPVSLHRFLFHQGRKVEIVHVSNHITSVALVFLGLTFTGTISFVFDVVLGGLAGWIAAGAALIFITAVWVGLPVRVRQRFAHTTARAQQDRAP